MTQKHSLFPLCSFVSLLTILFPLVSHAQSEDPRIEAGRRATAYVISQYDKVAFCGSAFCIDTSGLFVTNNHVVTNEGKVAKLTLVIAPGTKFSKTLPATVVAKNEALDVAIIKVNGAGPLTALNLAPAARISRLRETQNVLALGFPLGSQLSVQAKAAPEVSINTGRITALRHDKEILVDIQFDGKMNHGNSGGPLLDTRGSVIGYVWGGQEDKEINFAKPVTFLHYFLAKSKIVLTPPELLDAELARREVEQMNLPPIAGRAAVPSDAERAPAEKIIRELFAERYKDKTPKGREQLVLDLLEHLKTTKKDDVVGRYAMLTETRSIALAVNDTATALSLSEYLADEYQVSELDLLTEVVVKPLPLDDAHLQQAAVSATIGLLVAEAHAARHEFAKAIKLVPIVKSLAYRTHNPAAITSVAARTAKIEAQSAEFDQGLAALAKLKTAPADPQANLAAGRYYGLVIGDLPAALPYFVKSKDTALQAIAQAELAKPTRPDAQKDAGDLWWDQAAREKTNLAAADVCKDRAAYWYRQSAPALDGIAKVFVEKRLATLPATQPAPVAATAGVKVDLLAKVDTARDATAGRWHLEKQGLTNEPAVQAELRFPYRCPAEYDYTVRYTLTEGKWGAGLIFAHAGKAIFCELPNERSDTIRITPPVGANAAALAAKAPASTAGGCKICIQVRTDQITVIVDDQKVLNYQAPNWQPGPTMDFLKNDPPTLGALSFWGRMQITSAEVIEVPPKNPE